MSIPIINDPNERTFSAVVRKMLAARAAMPQIVAGLDERRFTTGSRLSAGMTVDPKTNGPTRIPFSDPEIHRGKSVIVKPLAVATADADLDDDVEQSTDDAVELNLAEAVVEAGLDTESETISEQGGEEEPEVEVGAEERD